MGSRTRHAMPTKQTYVQQCEELPQQRSGMQWWGGQTNASTW